MSSELNVPVSARPERIQKFEAACQHAEAALFDAVVACLAIEFHQGDESEYQAALGRLAAAVHELEAV